MPQHKSTGITRLKFWLTLEKSAVDPDPVGSGSFCWIRIGIYSKQMYFSFQYLLRRHKYFFRLCKSEMLDADCWITFLITDIVDWHCCKTFSPFYIMYVNLG